MKKTILKVMPIIGLVILNFIAVGYLYLELQQLKSRVSIAESGIVNTDTVGDESESAVINDLMVQNENLRNEVSILSSNVSKLENLSGQLGKTLETCEIVPEAYKGFHAAPGYETKLGMCLSSYSKLIKTTR